MAADRRGRPGRYQLGLGELGAFGARMRATLDCTSGWYAQQDWDGVPVSALLRSFGQARSLLLHLVGEDDTMSAVNVRYRPVKQTDRRSAHA